MATDHSHLFDGGANQSDDCDAHKNCLLTPMRRDGDTPFTVEHVIDATLVGVLVFAAVILVDVLPTLFSGNPVFLTPEQIVERMPTAAVGFLLAFAFMWARARGIDVMNVLRRIVNE